MQTSGGAQSASAGAGRLAVAAPQRNGKQELAARRDARAGAVARRCGRQRGPAGRAARGPAGRPLRVALAGARLALAVRGAGRRVMSTQVWAGSGCSRRTLVQVPIVPDSAHDWHALAQAVAQQTPCAQLPDMHSAPVRAERAVAASGRTSCRCTRCPASSSRRRRSAEALRAVAGERDARDGVGRDARAGRAAGGLGRVHVVRAALGARRRCPAGAGGSRPRRRIFRRCRRSTRAGSRRCCAGRRRRSAPACRHPATTAARSCGRRRAHASVAADAVDAEVADALAGGRAGLAVGLLAAAAALADAARRRSRRRWRSG